MPWQLTTPVNTGDLDIGTYAEVKVVSLTHRPNQKLIMVELEYGNTVAGVWTRGHLPVDKVNNHTIESQKYNDLTAMHKTVDSELTYIAAKRALYEHLAAEGVVAAGSII